MYARATARAKRVNFFYGERVAEPEIVTGRGNGERTVSKTLVNQDGLLDLHSRRQLKEFLETKVVSSLVRDLLAVDLFTRGATWLVSFARRAVDCDRAPGVVKVDVE